VVERGSELRLAQEALVEALVVRELRRQQLQCDLAVEAQMLGEVDARHAAAAEQLLDPVAGDLRADARVDGAHGTLLTTHIELTSST